MQIYVCDICGEELPNGIKSIEEENVMENRSDSDSSPFIRAAIAAQRSATQS